ncbi:MAG: hypothetical protein JNK90_10810 [Planctomycetaceae bacterium]|nr:hypothetical protein [Planctomycetaceae bacterium]
MKCTHRTGSTLLEMMILISTTSAMLLLIIGFIHRTLAWSSETTRITNELRSSQQLSSIFHRDVQLANQVQVIDDSTLVITATDNKVIRYQVQGNSLTRSEQEQTSAQGDIQQTDHIPGERFEFSDDRILKFSSPAEKKCICLHLFQTAVDFEQPKEMWCVESYLQPSGSGVKP